MRTMKIKNLKEKLWNLGNLIEELKDLEHELETLNCAIKDNFDKDDLNYLYQEIENCINNVDLENSIINWIKENQENENNED